MSDAVVTTPDTELKGLTRWLPSAARPFALLARFDRPIGWWLLYWPCAWSVLLAGGLRSDWPLLLWLLLGSIAMRGAGCVYNDIVDRDLDRQVARTRSRPIASGAMSVRAAWSPPYRTANIGAPDGPRHAAITNGCSKTGVDSKSG